MSGIIVALDFGSIEEALTVARAVKPHVRGFKVGLELIWAEGPSAVAALADEGLPVFADAKLHDIPNTVGRAARHLGTLGARWVTVHATGGPDMIEAAVEGLGSASEGSGILAVTVLTSLSPQTLDLVGLDGDPGDRVAALTSLAGDAGAEGVVCAVPEVPRARRASPDLVIVTPGIRSEGSSSDDQARISTPAAAASAGADLLVIGRSITGADDPAAAASCIAAEVASTSQNSNVGLTSEARPLE